MTQQSHTFRGELAFGGRGGQLLPLKYARTAHVPPSTNDLRIKQLLNSAFLGYEDLGGCYPPRPSTSVDNALLDLQNSSCPTQPHSTIAKYFDEFDL